MIVILFILAKLSVTTQYKKVKNIALNQTEIILYK